MTTSSGILQSFLKDSLNENKKFDALRFEDLLEYSRARCGLVKTDIDLTGVKFDEVEHLLPDEHAVILSEDHLFYVDKKNRKIKKLVQTDLNQADYNELKAKCSNSYKQAKGHTLKLVMSVSGRAFSEHHSNDFLTPLNFYLDILDNTEKVMFKYMGEEKLEQLKFDLRMALLLLMAERQHEIDYQKTENRKKYEKHIRHCAELLDAIEYQEFYKKNPEQAEFVDGKLVKYLGLTLGQEFGKELINWTDRKSKNIKEFIGALNEKRLYWVWGSVFLKTLIASIPEDFFYATQASDAIKTPDPCTGCLSWVLYYYRFGLELFLLLKHTIKGPWMSEEDAKTPWYERFQTQWAQRKFSLLNDSLWGTANLLGFFWLNGKSILGTWGDALTIALLIFDISVAIWDFEEQKTKHNKQMLQYDEDIKRLKEAIELNKQIEDEQERKAKERQMQMQIHALERERRTCEREWRMQKLSLINSIAYAVGLMLAFVVLTMPFMPIALPVAATLGLVGAVLCLAFTIINNAIKGGIEIYKTYETMKELKADYNDKVNQLRDKSLTSDERKLLFLEIKKLHADTEYQKQMITYQSVNLVRSIMLEVLIPAIIFSSLVFLPLGIGVLALGAALGLAIASHLLVDALFKPEEKKELEFDQEEYDRFCDSLVTTETEKTHGFFKNKNAFKAKAGDDLVLDKEKGIEPSNGDAYSKS